MIGTDVNLLVRCVYCTTGNEPSRGTCSQCGGPLPLERSWIVGADEDDETIDPIEAAESITALMFRDVAPAKPAGVIDRRWFYKLRLPAGRYSPVYFVFPQVDMLAYFAITSRDPEPYLRVRITANAAERLIDSPVLRAPIGISPMVFLQSPYMRVELVLDRPDATIDYPRPLDVELVLMLWQREDGRQW